MNSFNGTGRLVADPALKFIPGSGTAVCNFTIAVDRGLSRDKKSELEAQGKPTSDFLPILVFGKSAENCSQYLSKGKMCAVIGSVQTSNYEGSDGKRVYRTEILANRVEFLESNKTEKKAITEDDDFSFGKGSFEDFQSIEDDDDVPF